jgi:hypothetical protein
MPDFDSNDDPLRLSDSGEENPLELPKLTPRFAPRARQLAERRCRAGRTSLGRRLGPLLAARGRDAARNACGGRIVLLGSPQRRRRRLWTQCHGQAPGSAI